MGFSDFPLILIIRRETKCLFEISTEFVGVKINTKINKRDNFGKRLDAKIIFFPDWLLVELQSRIVPVAVVWV